MAETVGFLGLGVMGSRMARRLIDAGHDVALWSRDPSKAPTLNKAIAFASGAEVVARCDLVISCLLDDTAVSDVYRPLLKAARPGQVFAEHGTFSPSLARELSAAAAESGAQFLDIPVTGGPEGAAAGSLVAMAGGDDTALERIRPALSAYTKDVVRIGPSGAGLQLKLVNQLLVSVHMAAAAEAGALLRALDIPIEPALAVLGGGWAASAMLARELPRALAGDFESTGATIGGLVGVQELVAASYSEVGLLPRLLPLVQELFVSSSIEHAKADPAALIDLYELSIG